MEKQTDSRPNNQPQSFLSRHAASVIGIVAFLLMILATVYSSLKR